MPTEGIYWMELLKSLYIPLVFVLPFLLYGVVRVSVAHIKAHRNRQHRRGVEENAVDQPLSW